MSDSDGQVSPETDAQINFIGVLDLTTTTPGACLCFLVLVAYAVAACFSKSREQLDRVSFRLLVYTLIFNVLFGIAYAATPTSPGPGCNFGAFAVNFTLCFSTWFTTCIAINLQLVLVHGVNGKKLEKYYVIGTTILSLALNVPAYALHQVGWDEETTTCWYKNHDPKIRLRWIVGTQSFWICLAATIEAICSCVVIIWLYRFKRTTDVLAKAAHSSVDKSTTVTTTTTTKSTSIFRFTSSSRSKFMHQDPRYRKVILRIALYPIVSLMVNFSTVGLDLNMTINGMKTQLDVRLLVLDLILYGVRTLAYGILAAMDPSFINAVREMRGKKRSLGGGDRTLTNIVFASWGAPTASTAPSDSTTDGDDGSKLEIGVPLQQMTNLRNMTVKFASEVPGDMGVSLGAEALSQGLQEGQLTSEEIRDFERQL